MKRITLFPYLLLLLGFILLYSCNSADKGNQVKSAKMIVEQSSESKEKVENIKRIFYTLPSPLELTILFKKEGIEYQPERMHDVEAKERYTYSVKKALNLGVYGADLSYAGLFTNRIEAIKVFKTTQELASDLGIEQTFQKKFILRLEQSPDNRDTLLAVISDFFLENDIYLKESKQQDISTLVLAGGWIEGMYLGSTMLAEDANREGIREVISNQRNSLHNLIILLQNLDKSEEVDNIVRSITKLEKHFIEIPIQKVESTDVYKDEEGVLHIDDNKAQNITLSDSTFQIIKKKITAIRNDIVR